jgi:hypothetical protein
VTLVDVRAGLTGGVVRAHVLEDLGNVVGDDHLAMVGCSLAFGLNQMLALDQQLSLECSLVGDVVVEVMASDVDDSFTSAAVLLGALALLALEGRHHCCAWWALLDIFAGMARGVAGGGHILEDLVNVLVDDLRAVS